MYMEDELEQEENERRIAAEKKLVEMSGGKAVWQIDEEIEKIKLEEEIEERVNAELNYQSKMKLDIESLDYNAEEVIEGVSATVSQLEQNLSQSPHVELISVEEFSNDNDSLESIKAAEMLIELKDRMRREVIAEKTFSDVVRGR